MRDIARKTGMAAATVYTYFSDKDALFRAIVDPAAKKLAAGMQGSMTGFSSDIGVQTAIDEVFTLETAKASLLRLFDLIYSDLDEFRLLLHGAKGSSMANFRERVTSRYAELCIPLLEAASARFGKARKYSELSSRLVFMLYFEIAEQIVLKNIPREQAERDAEQWAGIIRGSWFGLLGMLQEESHD
jgi:AcrR family transcriptional regulator